MNCCESEQNNTHNDHSSDAHGHGMTDAGARLYIRRFLVVTVLLVPLVLANPTVAGFLGISAPALGPWVQFGIATIIFGFSLIFFRHARHEIRAGQYGMMTLVSLAVGAGYLFSVVSTFVSALDASFYLEISTLVWVLLFGHYLEAKSSAAAGDALQAVTELLPQTAHKVEGDRYVDIRVDALEAGDVVLVKSGEKIPADGVIENGSAHVDQSLLTGESKPISKRPGDEVPAGSICLDGSLTVRLTRVGDNSTVGHIRDLVARAGKTKPPTQRIADKAAGVLTFVAAGVALITLFVWGVIVGEPFVFAITLAITVLVIACPHALGLAIPTVTTITTTLAARNGLFIKDLAAIEAIRHADWVVFDKTGTLTVGDFRVTNVESVGDVSADEVLLIAASVEQHTSHLIGNAIVRHARARDLDLTDIAEFEDIAGKGVRARVGGTMYTIGSRQLVANEGAVDQSSDATAGTVVLVAREDELIGRIVLSDTTKPSAYRAVANLHEMGVRVAILTGDNERVAESVSAELGIDTYFANVLPEDKYKYIRRLQEAGNTVLMVGDGVNDAPALRQADVGIAIGAGTDVAVEAGEVVLTDNDPADVVRLIALSKRAYRKIIQNLIWALGYNVIAIPAAAGAFVAWGFVLRPEIGALVMSLSTIVVVLNALTLKRTEISNV